jgi:hypothetical protein
MAAAESHARVNQKAAGTTDDNKADCKTNGSDNAAHQLNTVTWYLMNDGRYNKIKPFFSNIPFEHPEARQTNIECEPHDIVVTDIRGHEDELSLDIQGFQVLQTDLQIDYEKFADNNWIKEKHYPLVERWLREVLGENVVERIYIYDHTVCWRPAIHYLHVWMETLKKKNAHRCAVTTRKRRLHLEAQKVHCSLYQQHTLVLNQTCD